jgi:hypothetical protein
VASFTCQLYYAFFNSFSTETLFDSVNLTLYNITFTSLPIFVFALLEQERRKKFSIKIQNGCSSVADPGSRMLIYPGSEFFPTSIPDPNFFHAGSALNNLSILTQKIGF